MPTLDLCTKCYHLSVPNSHNETESKINFHVVITLLHYVRQKTRPQQKFPLFVRSITIQHVIFLNSVHQPRFFLS